MILTPSRREDLPPALRAAFENGTRIEAVDLRALDRILAHTPEDMTVTVEAGLTLATFQTALAQQRQWLPIDPPNADRLTIGALLATNASGPRRFGYGTIRDHLIGLQVALADGRLIRSGGKVVKNVAGFDLLKLFVGDHGSLGIVVEATFKLLPLPETEQFVQIPCDSLAMAGERIQAVLDSELTPVVMDLHAPVPPHTSRAVVQLVLGLAGSREDVDWQLATARALGFAESATLDYEARFHAAGGPAPHRASVLPSRLIETIERITPDSFVARAGNGILCHRGGQPRPPEPRPDKLISRTKDAFDPKHILPAPPP